MCHKALIWNIFSLNMAGIYIHIPFCKSRCIYCDFYSTTHADMQSRYIQCLIKELHARNNYVRQPIETVYLGGGTPSVLSADNLRLLISEINKTYPVGNIETTIECNPDDVTPEYAELIKSIGFNRVSMGAQTFLQERLSFLNRRHTSEQVEKAVRSLKDAGINNISIDLMYGFPEETIDEWSYDVDKALSLNVQHISAYSLIYDKGTYLYQLLESGKIKKVDEETERSMFYLLIDKLESAKYEHYELSNFARKGFRSQHNSSYWKGIPYLGLGAAAHSFDGKSRQWNVADIIRYMNGQEKGMPQFETEELDKTTRYNETVMTSLRTTEGIDTKALHIDYGDELFNYCLSMAKQHIDRGSMELYGKNPNLRLCKKSLFVSDDIISDLMFVK